MNIKKTIFFTVVIALLISSFAAMAFAEAYKRPMPTHPLSYGNTVLGGNMPVVCVPLTATTKDKILEEAKFVAELKPDMVEVRADFWDCIEDTHASVAMLRDIDKIIGEIGRAHV